MQGYFGGKVDLIFQRVLEIWGGTPDLYVIIIVFSVWRRSFWVLILLMIAFGWTRLIGIVRAEFLRARNFRICSCRQGLGRVGPYNHRAACAAQRDSGDADHAAVRRLWRHRLAGGAGLSGLWPACLVALAGPAFAAGAANLQMPSLAFIAFFTFAIHAIAAGLHL